MNRSATVAALLLVAAGGFGIWRGLREEPAPEAAHPTSQVSHTPPSGEAPQAEQATIPPKKEAAPTPAAPKTAKVGSVRYPDGSTQPALNGVLTDIVIEWGTRPFSPIVGTEDGPGGWKWYVHENGTRSTTAMVTTNGVPQPMGLVAEPTQALPVYPGNDGKTPAPLPTGGQK